MGQLGSVDYTIIGLLFAFVNIIAAAAKVYIDSRAAPKSILLEDERNALLTLYRMHQVKAPNTGIPIWYNPPQFIETMQESSKQLTIISMQLKALIDAIKEEKKNE